MLEYIDFIELFYDAEYHCKLNEDACKLKYEEALEIYKKDSKNVFIPLSKYFNKTEYGV